MSSWLKEDGTDDYLPDEGGLTVRGRKRHIVCAANQYGGKIYIGIRHLCPLMHQNIKGYMTSKQRNSHLKDMTLEEEQGFIDQWGNWLTRTEAMNVAKANGQPIDMDRNGHSTQLFSEGLY